MKGRNFHILAGLSIVLCLTLCSEFSVLAQSTNSSEQQQIDELRDEVEQLRNKSIMMKPAS